MVTENTGLQPLNFFMTLFPFLISSAIVGARIWKKVRKHKFATDDLLILIAQVLAIGLTVATCILIKKSYIGYRPEKIPTGAVNKIEASKWRFINAVIYNPLLTLIKVSFTVTLIKLDPPSIWVKTSLWTLFAVNIMFGIAGTLVAVLNCRPIPKFWDRTIPGSCMNTAQYIYGTISVTIITDALVSVVPVCILFGLQMPRKTKALVISFLSLGLIVTAIASYRLSVFVEVFSIDNPLQNESSHNVRTPLSNIEASLAAIAACGPTLKHILGRIISTTESGHRQLRGSILQRETVCPIRSNSAREHALDVDADPIRNLSNSSTVELTDALDWPKSQSNHWQNDTEEERGSIRTEDLTIVGIEQKRVL